MNEPGGTPSSAGSTGPSSPVSGDATLGPRTHGTVARLLHWAVVLMVIVQIPAGIAMTSEPLARFADPLFILHKGLGSILLAVVVARALWRIIHRPPPFPDYMPAREQRIAHLTHMALYALLVVMVVSGYVRTVGDSYPIELLDAMGVPPLIPVMPRLAAVMLVVHQFAVIALVGLAAVHVGVVLKHQLVDGNPVLARMWPPVQKESSTLPASQAD